MAWRLKFIRWTSTCWADPREHLVECGIQPNTVYATEAECREICDLLAKSADYTGIAGIFEPEQV